LARSPFTVLLNTFSIEVQSDVFIRDGPRRQQVELWILDLDHRTAGIGQIMQFLIERIAERHDARRQILVVLVLHSISHELRSDSAELDRFRSETLRRFPDFCVTAFRRAPQGDNLRMTRASR